MGISLSLIGYSKVFPQVGDELTQPLKWMTIFFYCIIPIIGWLITLFAMRYYKLDKAAMKNLYSLKGGKNDKYKKGNPAQRGAQKPEVCHIILHLQVFLII